MATAALFERDPDALPNLLQIFSTSQYLSDLLVVDQEAYDLLRMTEGQPVSRAGARRRAGRRRAGAREPRRRARPSLRRFKRRETAADRLRRHRPQPAGGNGRPADFLSGRRDRRGGARLSPGAICEEQYGQPLRTDGEPLPVRRARRSASWAALELNYSSDIDLIFLYEQDGQTDARRTVSNQEYLRAAGERSDPPAHRDDRSGLDLSRRPAVAARGFARPALPELRQHAFVLRREGPHLGAAGVREGPADRRRPRTWAASCSTGSSPGSIAAI